MPNVPPRPVVRLRWVRDTAVSQVPPRNSRYSCYHGFTIGYTTPMTDVSTYPRPPVRLAAFEVRFPPVDALASETRVRPLHRDLRSAFPFFEPIRVPVAIQLAPDGVTHETAHRFRLSSRTRTTAVTVGEDIAIVETSDYQSYEHLRDRIQDVLERVAELDEIVGMSRIGLRYVNEIRIDGVGDNPSEWASFLTDSLVAPLRLVDEPLHSLEGAVVFRPGRDRNVTVRFGALRGRAVSPLGPLRVRDLGDGPFFLLDIDSFWETTPEELPEFRVTTVIETLDALHVSAQDVFEAAITNKVRNSFGASKPIAR